MIDILTILYEESNKSIRKEKIAQYQSRGPFESTQGLGEDASSFKK